MLTSEQQVKQPADVLAAGALEELQQAERIRELEAEINRLRSGPSVMRLMSELEEAHVRAARAEAEVLDLKKFLREVAAEVREAEHMAQAQAAEQIDPALKEACEVIGRDIVIRIGQEVTSARRKYPHFADDHADAVGAVKSEMLEWEAQAMRVERLHMVPSFSAFNGTSRQRFIQGDRRDKAETEGVQVIATLVRYLRREYLGAPVVS